MTMGNLVIAFQAHVESCGQVAPGCVPESGGQAVIGNMGNLDMRFKSLRLIVGVRALPYYTVHIVYY